MKSIYTVGYEGSNIDKFLENVKTHNVKLIVDVREKPISRKKGFSKNSLCASLNANGIEYIHIPQLGSPKQIRDKLHETWDYHEFFQEYRVYISSELDIIMGILDRLESTPSCLMCFEHDPKTCHRSILAEYIEMYSNDIDRIEDIS